MLRFLIADDHEIVRRGLKHILLHEYPSAHIHEAADGNTLLEMALQQDWDLIITDISMPVLSGIKALREIKNKKPGTPVLILSLQTSEQYSKTALRAGASGYVSKDAPHEELVSSISNILRGEKQWHPVIGAENKPASEKLPHELLTLREMEVLRMLAGGKALVEIAAALSLSPSTISSFRARILKKIGAENNADLVRYAIENKLL